MNEEKYVEMLEDGELYDYITDLQEKVKLFENIVYKYDELKEENERLNKKLQESIQWSECRTKEWLDYKSRNEKAIEIYDETIDYLTTINTEFMDSNTKMTIKEMIKNLEKQLNILQGGDKE